MNLNKEIWHLTAPAIVSNLTVPVLGLCDTAISGHLGGSIPMAGTAVGALMFNVLFWLFGFLRMGTTGLTAQDFGAGGDGMGALKRAGLIALVSGGALLACQWPISRLLLWILSPEGEVGALALTYFRISIWSTPAVLFAMALTGWFVGMQNTVYPMLVSIAVNISNILLSLLFVFGCGWGVAGLAAGTLCANWIGTLLAIAFAVALRRRWLREHGRGRSGQGVTHSWGRFFRVNLDLFLRSACIMAITIGLSAFGNRLGALAVAANAIILQFFNFFSYFMDGIAYAGEALVGRFVGAADFGHLRKSIRLSLMWSAVLALLFFLIYLIFTPGIVGLLTDARDVLEYTLSLRTWIVLIPPLTVAAFIFDGFYIGATATRRMLWTTVASTALFFLLCFWHPAGAEAWTLPDIRSLWSAFLAYLVCRGALLALQTPRIISPDFVLKQTSNAEICQR